MHLYSTVTLKPTDNNIKLKCKEIKNIYRYKTNHYSSYLPGSIRWISLALALVIQL